VIPGSYGTEDFAYERQELTHLRYRERSQALEEGQRIELGPDHSNVRGDAEHPVIERRPLLPFCEQALPV
jgi:hypothetical protein